MAILILYHKVRETETEVEYSYSLGMELPEEGRLILNAKDPRTRPSSGADNPSGQEAAGKILWERQRNSTWPEDGAIQA